jgi:uncharacterized protein YifE (UPF0438 family)
MKKIFFSLLVTFLLHATTHAQINETPVTAGDYSILKLDVLNLMGIGIQKLHLGYEISPMKANDNSLPTINFNVNIPFNGLNKIDMKYGLEAGTELRFYQVRRNRDLPIAEGFFMGVGIDGGFVSFNKTEEYYSNFGSVREIDNSYNRVRTGIYLLAGAQSRLGSKLFFDVNMGMGWSNVNVKQTNTEDLGTYQKNTDYTSPFYLLYNEGKGQRFYMPVTISLGYNFGKR